MTDLQLSALNFIRAHHRELGEWPTVPGVVG